MNGRLLDLMLPYIDGSKVCRRLKTDDRTRTVPLVILTARDEPHGAQRAEKAGCAAYLKKPCSPPELTAVIKRLLGRQEPG